LPLSIAAIQGVLRTAPFRWFIAGGHALELAVGQAWRAHDDLDVGVCRRDLGAVFQHLSGWDLHVGAAGVLSPWDGRPLSEQRHENNIWARRNTDEPWAFDLIVGGGDDEVWWSRRDPAIRLPWPDAVQHVSDIPYLAPHVQLLMKSKSPRPKDDLDAEVVIPVLEHDQRDWLAGHLAQGHPWQAIIRRSGAAG
jgi:hypothetical protein